MPVFVEIPPVAPARFGLLDAAAVQPFSDVHMGFDGVQYQPNCGIAYTTRAACMPAESGESDGGTTKVVTDGIPVMEADPFAVYHLFQCRAPGSIQTAQARARASFELGEGAGVEARFADFLSTEASVTDITPVSGALFLPDGLAALEAWIGTQYGGVPTIHGDRASASVLATLNALTVTGNRLQTALGSRFAAGAGYANALLDPSGGADAIDETWLYVTGAVHVWRGEVFYTDPTMLLTSSVVQAPRGMDSLTAASVSPPANITTRASNEYRVLVEREYVVGTECAVGAVKVKRSACCESNGGLPS